MQMMRKSPDLRKKTFESARPASVVLHESFVSGEVGVMVSHSIIEISKSLKANSESSKRGLNHNLIIYLRKLRVIMIWA